jgi:hypothetical protein
VEITFRQPARHVATASPRFCSNCGHPVVVGDARFCKDCGAALAGGIRLKQHLDWNPWLAGCLSLVPGLGQLYKGQRWQAVAWFFGVVIAYGAFPFGALTHLVCVANAALGGALEFPRSGAPAAGANRGSQAGY